MQRSSLALALACVLPAWCQAGKVPAQGGAKSICVLGTDFDAGIPAGWDIGTAVEQQDPLNNGLGIFVDAWRTGSSAEANANGWFPVPDVPAGNRFAMANDDASPCNCAMGDVTLTSPAFDLSGLQDAAVRLRAFTNGAFGGGDGVVEASADGVTWSTVATIAPRAHAWRPVLADLSAFDGEPAVRIRFRWSDNGGWAGGLAIDDVCVSARAAHDLVLLDAFLCDARTTAFDPTARTLPYTLLPLEQAEPMVVKAIVLNAGTLGAITVTCTATITLDGAPQGSFTSSVGAVGAGAVDTLVVSTGWTPAAAGRVQVAVSVSALSADDEPSDNGLERWMDVTAPGLADGNNAMALDDSTVTGGVFNGGNDYAVALRCEIGPAGSQAHAVSFLPSQGSVAGARVVGKLLDGQFNLIAASAEHVITQVELDDAITQRRQVNLSFDDPVDLDAQADVYAVIEHNSDSGDVHVALAQAATHGSAMLYDGPGIAWNYLLNVPVVRLHLSEPEVGIDERPASAGDPVLAPVPADEATWLLLEADAAAGATWLLHDAGGRLMGRGLCTGTRTRIATAQLPAGPYVLVVRTGQGLRSARLVVAH
jgi:hypothetical protein